VAFVRRTGPGSGVYGAKITGGGSGGTVAIIGRTDAAPLVQAIAARYARRRGHAARVFGGSSPGAAACGVCDLRL
jgi:L-arabinokinase